VGRNDEKLSRAMKDAVVAARESGMSPAETVEHAAAGGLDDLPPFEIAESTIRRLVAFHRRQQHTAAGNGGAEEAGASEDLPEKDRLRAIAESTIARVEQLESPTASDLSAAQQAQRVIDDANRRARRARFAKPAPAEDEPSELWRRLIDQMEQERQATEEAIAKRRGEQCRCEPMANDGSNYATAIDPRPWLLHDGAPTCGTCRLPITNWQTRLDRYPVLLEQIEAARDRSRTTRSDAA
jgi:hypothetical protein